MSDFSLGYSESGKYYFCNVDFGKRLTGIEHASIKRANLFIRHLGVVPCMLTRALNLDVHLNWQHYKQIGLVDPEVPLLSLYDDLMGISEGESLLPAKVAYDEGWKSIDVPNTLVPHQRVRHPNGEMRLYIVWRDSGRTVLDYINYFFGGKKIQRDKFNRFGQLAISQYLGERGRVVKEDYYTPAGQRCLTRFFDESQKIVLIQCFDVKTGAYQCFDNEDALVAEWLVRKFGESEGNTFLIDKNRSWVQPLGRLSQKTPQRLISIIHSHHIRAASTDLMKGALNSNYVDVLTGKVKVDRCVVLTSQQQQDIQKRFVGMEYDLACIPHAQEASGDRAIKRDKDLLVALVRLSPEKRIEDMVRIMKGIHHDYPSKRLEIYGEGKERESLEALIRDLGLEKVVFLKGYVEDVGEIFSRAALSLLTSKFEAFSLSVLESLAHGCPVLAYDIKYGPASMIQNAENGWLVEAGNIEAAVQVLSSLFAAQDKLEKASVNAYLSAQRFNPKEVARAWSRVLFG